MKLSNDWNSAAIASLIGITSASQLANVSQTCHINLLEVIVVVSCIEIKFNCYNKMDAQIHSTSMNSYEYVHNVLVP